MPTNIRLLLQPLTPSRLVLFDLDDNEVLVRYATHGHFRDGHYLRIGHGYQTGFVLVTFRDRDGDHEYAVAQAHMMHFMRTIAFSDSVRTALVACQGKFLGTYPVDQPSLSI